MATSFQIDKTRGASPRTPDEPPRYARSIGFRYMSADAERAMAHRAEPRPCFDVLVVDSTSGKRFKSAIACGGSPPLTAFGSHEQERLTLEYFSSAGGHKACPPNGSHAKLCGRSRVPKPTRRAGCRQ